MKVGQAFRYRNNNVEPKTELECELADRPASNLGFVPIGVVWVVASENAADNTRIVRIDRSRFVGIDGMVVVPSRRIFRFIGFHRTKNGDKVCMRRPKN